MKNLLRTLFSKTQRPKTSTPPTESEAAPVNSMDDARTRTEVPEAHDGTVWIQNDQMVVTNPTGAGSFPTLWIPDDSRVSVTINGNKKVGDIFVTEADTIRVNFNARNPLRTFQVKIAEDKLSVSVKACIAEGGEVHLVNALPSRRAIVHITECPILPASSPVQDLLDSLRPYCFTGQMDYEAIDELCRCTVTTEAVVVRGTAPKPASPGSYRRVHLAEDMDHELRTRRYATVSIGTTIAVYEPGMPGVEGVDVFGQVITVKNWDKVQALGSGVVQVNNYVVATRSGRPVFTKKRIDVVPELLVNHDLTPEDGPIIFDGCVVIRGSVLDGAYVRATGSVTVYGNVFQATIIGEEGVYITHNVVSSKIWSGYSEIICGDLLGLVRNINAGLKQFHAEYIAVTSKAGKKFGASKIHMLPYILLEERHCSLEQRLHTFIDRYSEHLFDTDEEYRAIVQVWQRSWQGIYRTHITHEHILELMILFQNYQQTLEISRTGTTGSISVPEVFNSTLQASGNIAVRGVGAFSSALESGHTIKVTGLVRGGFLIASTGVSIGELGSPYETETSVRIKGEHGVVLVKMRHPNTLIDVGGVRNRNLVQEKNVRLGGE